MIIDATDTILGRLSSHCAKKALNGEDIIIVNAEKAIISGRKTDILRKYKFKRNTGDVMKGPFISRMPDRIVRRTIRGMLPWSTSRGKVAFKKIQVHIGEPKNITGVRTKLEQYNKTTLNNPKYTTIADVSKWLGAK
ncbi:MAG: 50S ribosomal protein L13 [archaeon]